MTAFKVMTWNIENLYPAEHRYGPNTADEYEQKLGALVGAMEHIDADVIAVQEVGDVATFDDLVRRLPRDYRHTVLSDHPDPRGIRVGFISKLALTQREHMIDFHPDGLATVPGVGADGDPTEVTRFGRGIVRVRVRPRPNFNVHLITAHLKSKLLTFRGPRGGTLFSTDDEDLRAKVGGVALIKRTAEAVALRAKANEILEGNADDAVIILGDMNDGIHAATTQLLQGPTGSEINTTGFDRGDKGDYVRLFNLCLHIDEAQRYSRIHKGTGEMLDHIFVSEEMVPRGPDDPNRVDDLRIEPTVTSHVHAIGGLPSITDDPGERTGEEGSDHAPVSATFQIPD
jgi:endonuclease/exonuclease/phosphatase family metal-dependent hydrolase